MHRKRARRILGISKKSVSWVLRSEEEGWLLLARSGFVAGAARDGAGADGKVIIERLCISLPYVEKPLNSKVIESFAPELRSRKCFVFRDYYVLCIYVMNILWTFRISVSGYGTCKADKSKKTDSIMLKKIIVVKRIKCQILLFLKVKSKYK